MLLLTDRALPDIEEIEANPIERWGQDRADNYIADLNGALGRPADNLSPFRSRPDYPGRLLFYNAREHVLMGDVIGDIGYVLTVWHGSMDFIDRLSSLEPSLMEEAEIMARQIEGEAN